MSYNGTGRGFVRHLADNLDAEDARTLALHGTSSGVPDLIYTYDIARLWTAYEQDILDILHENLDITEFCDGITLHYDRLPMPSDYVCAAAEIVAPDVHRMITGEYPE